MRFEDGKLIIYEDDEAAAMRYNMGDWYEGEYLWSKMTTPERQEVLNAITPEVGDPIFWAKPYDGITQHELDDAPNYWINTDDIEQIFGVKPGFIVKASALTLGKTVGQIWQLLKWCQEKE